MRAGSLSRHIALLITLTSIVSLSAQEPVYRAGTTHVVLDVVVTGDNDSPVETLTRDDFQVTDNGRPQAISEFEHIVVPQQDRAALLASPEFVPADTFDNANPPKTARAFVVIIDEGSIEPAYIVPLRRAMQEFVRRLTPDDKVAVTYIGRSDLGQDFTNDPWRILAAMDRFPEAYGSGAVQDLGSIVTMTNGRDLLLVLQNTVEAASVAREERRAIVLVSRGTFVPYFERDWEDFYEMARRADVPVYTLDPTGLAAAELGLQLKLEDQTPKNRATLEGTRQTGKVRLKEMASNTGGQAFVDNWNIAGAVDDILQDNGSYYLLGFDPTPYVRDGKFHPVKVSVKGDGLHVRAREGYTSEPPDAGRAPAAGDAFLKSLGHSVAGGALGLRVSNTVIQPSSHGNLSVMTCDMSYPDGVMLPETDDLRISWIALDPDGKILAGQDVRRSIRPSSIPAGQPVPIVALLDVPGHARSLRLAIGSTSLGIQGTLSVPYEPLKTSDGQPSVTNLLIGRSSADTASAVTIGADLSALPFLPTASRTFSRSDRLEIYAKTFSADSAQLSLSRDGAVVARIPITPKMSGATGDVRAAISLADLNAGRYVLELEAVDKKGARAARAVVITIR